MRVREPRQRAQPRRARPPQPSGGESEEDRRGREGGDVHGQRRHQARVRLADHRVERGQHQRVERVEAGGAGDPVEGRTVPRGQVRGDAEVVERVVREVIDQALGGRGQKEGEHRRRHDGGRSHGELEAARHHGPRQCSPTGWVLRSPRHVSQGAREARSPGRRERARGPRGSAVVGGAPREPHRRAPRRGARIPVGDDHRPVPRSRRLPLGRLARGAGLLGRVLHPELRARGRQRRLAPGQLDPGHLRGPARAGSGSGRTPEGSRASTGRPGASRCCATIPRIRRA